MNINIIQEAIDENLLPKIIDIDNGVRRALYYETDAHNKYIIIFFKDKEKTSFPIHVTEDMGSYEALERKVIETLRYIK